MTETTTRPPVITEYIAARNRFDGDRLLAVFADDALINDDHREFWGKAAIKPFLDEEFIAAKVTMEVPRVIAHHGQYIIPAIVDGEYDKTGLPDPLILTNYITVEGDRIVTLIIIHNHARA